MPKKKRTLDQSWCDAIIAAKSGSRFAYHLAFVKLNLFHPADILTLAMSELRDVFEGVEPAELVSLVWHRYERVPKHLDAMIDILDFEVDDILADIGISSKTEIATQGQKKHWDNLLTTLLRSIAMLRETKLSVQ